MLEKPILKRGKLFWGMEGGETCPYCKSGTITKRIGKYGNFFGCTSYPRCAFTEKIPKEEDEDYFDIDSII